MKTVIGKRIIVRLMEKYYTSNSGPYLITSPLKNGSKKSLLPLVKRKIPLPA
jgi:hypothetical protein